MFVWESYRAHKVQEWITIEEIKIAAFSQISAGSCHYFPQLILLDDYINGCQLFVRSDSKLLY
jgi:hypothetical protein